MQPWFRFNLIILTLALVFTTSLAWAQQCTNPTGYTGQREYFNGSYKYCNGLGWVDAPCTDPVWSASLRRYWKFDQSAGDPIDSFATNATTLSIGAGSWQPANGYRDGALRFDGNNTYVNAGGNTTTDMDDLFAGSGLSISAWIYPTGLGEGNAGTIISKDNSNNATATSGWILRLSSSNRIEFTHEYNGNDLLRRSANNAISLNAWNHVVVTWNGNADATNVHIYINGTEASYAGGSGGATTNGTSTRASDAARDMIIGNNRVASLNRAFAGDIDEVYVFSGILSADDRSSLYARGCGVLNTCGTVGQVQYDATNNRYTYCDGTSLLNLGCATPSSSTAPEDDFSEPTETNLVGHWRLDESSGNFIDTSGNGWTGTSVNGGPSHSPASGKINGAALFSPTDYAADETQPHIDLGTSIDISGASYTITAWVNPTDYNDWRAITGKRSDGWTNVRWFFGLSATDGAVTIFSNTGVYHTFAYQAPTNQWTHLAVVANSQQSILYVNGWIVEVGPGVAPAAGATGAHANIGDNGENDSNGLNPGHDGDPFKGWIDDVRIYNGNLSTGEILAIYNSGLETGLVGHWKLNESSGTSTADSSGQGFTGTLTSGPVWRPTNGRMRGALELDGVDDYIDLGTTGNLNFDSQLTITAWIRPDTYGEDTGGGIRYGTIFDRTNGNDGYLFGIRHDGRMYLWNNTSGESNSNAGVIDLARWQHVAVTYANGVTSFYVDGVYQSGGAFTLLPGGASVATSIARWNGGTQENFDGKIDDVRVYNRALNIGEIQSLYKVAGPIGHWKFDETSGGSAADVGDNNPGTLNNGATWTTSGSVSGALQLDGNDDDVSVSNETNFDFDRDQPFSISAWVNRTSNTAENDIFSKTDPNNQFLGFNLWLPPSGDVNCASGSNCVAFHINGSGASRIYARSGNNLVPTGTWTHIAATYDGSSDGTGIRLYIDGVSTTVTLDQNTLNNSILHNIAPVLGGDASSPVCCGFHGGLDDLRVYDRVLTASEVKAVYNDGGRPANLIARWKLDEKSGTTTSDALGTFNGTLNNGPVWLSTSGVIKGALAYDGSNDYVAIADPGASALDFAGGSSITLSGWAWANPGNSGVAKNFILKGSSSSGSYNYGLELNSSDRVSFRFNNAIWQSTNANYIPASWAHYAVTYTFGTSASIRVYVNGAQISGSWTSGTGNEVVTVNNEPLFIGAVSNAGAQSFNGALDDWRIYNTALTAPQIATLYNQSNPGICVGLGQCNVIGAVEIDPSRPVLKWCNGTQWLPLSRGN